MFGATRESEWGSQHWTYSGVSFLGLSNAAGFVLTLFSFCFRRIRTTRRRISSLRGHLALNCRQKQSYFPLSREPSQINFITKSDQYPTALIQTHLLPLLFLRRKYKDSRISSSHASFINTQRPIVSAREIKKLAHQISLSPNSFIVRT